MDSFNAMFGHISGCNDKSRSQGGNGHGMTYIVADNVFGMRTRCVKQTMSLKRLVPRFAHSCWQGDVAMLN